MEEQQSKKKNYAVNLRLTSEEAVILNSLSGEAGISPTGYATQVLKSHLSSQTAEMLVKVSPIEDILNRVLDERMKRFENRLAGLLVKAMLAALEAKGYALNVLRQVLNLRKLPETDITKMMATIKETVYKSAKDKLTGKQDEEEIS